MKNYKFIATIIVIIFLNLNLYAQQGTEIEIDKTPQQSTTGKYRPADVSEGIVGITSKAQIVISGVPSYLWQHGCGPTALGMVIGYYDSKGYPDLIPGDASTQTTEVNNAIANTEHYNDYSLPIDSYPNLQQDKSELGGAHTSNCLGDYMHTSWSLDGNYYGWSYSSKIDDAFVAYINQQNATYTTYTTYEWFGTGSWSIYMNEINNNRPVVLLVDSDGDGSTDHFVTGIGYNTTDTTYGIFDTWDHSIHWYKWRALSDTYQWGIYGFNILQIGGQTALVDLEPYIPNNASYVWDDKIIIKNTTVTNGYQDMHDDVIYVGENVYLSFSYWNNSSTDIDDDFRIQILIDGTDEFSTYQTSTLQGYYYCMWWNQPVSRTLTAGVHTVKMIVDVDDDILETDETDNEYTKTFTVYSGSDLVDINENDVYIYPNPASDKIIISTKENIENKNAEIYSIGGLLIKKSVIKNNMIEISELKQGIYILKIPDKNIIKKFIVK